MSRYGKNDIECLPVIRKKRMTATALKLVVGAAFVAAVTTKTVENWQQVLQDAERIRAESNIKTTPFQPEVLKLANPEI
jgi:hypothetical protein